MSTFSGLSTALSALYTQRRGLDLTGQNIANVNTEGYSRQRAELQAVENVRSPAAYSTGSPGGGGVEVAAVTRLHDEFLDNRTRVEKGLNEYLAGQKAVFSNIEQIIGEPSDSGLQSQMSQMWASWSDVANRPGDGAPRTQLLTRARTVADTLQTNRESLGTLWEATREKLVAHKDEVNQTAKGVAELNERIAFANQASLPTNELSDRRDQLVMRLSELTGAAARPRPDGTVDVLLSGSALVQGKTARELEVVGSETMDGQAANKVMVRFADTHLNAGVTTGAMASGIEALSRTVPDTVKGLDAVAGQLIAAVNDQHHKGWDLTNPASQPGVDFFSGTDASNITVALTKGEQIAAASSATTRFEGGNATELSNLAKQASGPDATYRTFVADLGISAQTINRRADAQSVITEDVNASRLAESGVSLDEEMTNMIQYQRAYEAAAKVMSVVDATLDTLINNMKR